MVEAYCVKCRDKKEMKDPKRKSMQGKGGVTRWALKDVCGCGTNLYRIVSEKDAMKYPEAEA